jgi:hypothetical protein
LIFDIIGLELEAVKVIVAIAVVLLVKVNDVSSVKVMKPLPIMKLKGKHDSSIFEEARYATLLLGDNYRQLPVCKDDKLLSLPLK